MTTNGFVPHAERSQTGEYHANQVKAILARGGAGNGYYNVPRELLEGDDNPMKYLSRTEISEQEIGLLARRVGDMNSIQKGYTNKPMVWAVKYNARQSLNRKSRREVVSIESGRREMMRPPMFGSGVRDMHGTVDQNKGVKP